jgi:hypothetical protein
VLFAGGVASLVVDEDFRAPVQQMTQLAGLGGFWTLFTLDPDPEVPSYAPGALAAGSFATAGLVATNLAMHRPTRGRVLEDFARMRTGNQRARLSKGDVDRAEDDLRGLDQPIPSWVIHAPIIASGIVAMVPSIADGFENGDRRLIATAGALYVLFGVLGALPRSPFHEYQKSLREAGLEGVALGPGPRGSAGVSISGRF